MILAFSKTTEALLAGRKSVTRREWGDRHYENVKRKFDDATAKGEPFHMQAWSASPHRGGKQIGKVVITSLTREPTRDIPDSDWEAEGFEYMEHNGIDVGPDQACVELWNQWRSDQDKITTVVRFELTDDSECAWWECECKDITHGWRHKKAGGTYCSCCGVHHGSHPGATEAEKQAWTVEKAKYIS
jgi:hypothetical protein